MLSYPTSPRCLSTMPRQNTQAPPLFAVAVKARRGHLGLTGDQLADRTFDFNTKENAISQRTVSAVETGRQDPINLSAYRFGWLLDALEWTPNQFSEATGLIVPTSLMREVLPLETISLGEIVPIRYLGDVAGGLFASGQSVDDLKLIDVPRFFIGTYNPKDLFCLTVSGHSMASPNAKLDIAEGSLVLVHSKLERQSGKVVVCYLLDEGIGVIKTWQESDDGTWLTSFNPDQTTYAPIALSKSTRARFCGVVIGSYKPMVTPNGKTLF